MKTFRTTWKPLYGNGKCLKVTAVAENKEQAVRNQVNMLRIGYKAIRTVEIKLS